MKSLIFSAILLTIVLSIYSCNQQTPEQIHIYEINEITLTAQKAYENPYTDVECWVHLQGPGFDQRIYGFWDGDQTFKVRLVATAPGTWTWESSSNQPDDQGLNGNKGTFEALAWSDQEIAANPNRRGYIQTSPNGHALQYADGTPFFFLADTWWSAFTWRYPLTGTAPNPDWIPGPDGHSFENIVLYRKRQGYNSLAVIACYPNWHDDAYPAQYVDDNGIGIRQAWEKFSTPSAKDMHDEAGNIPFELDNNGTMANFDRINPAYFRSMDKKMAYLDSIGFVPFLEVVRRDHGPSWKAYFDWPSSFVRYIQYMVARYGAYNLIFSPIHLDWIPPVFSLSGEEFNEAIVAWYEQYGPLPYGQPVTTLIDGATHTTYGSGEKVPWLTMHSVGNYPRNHGFYPLLEEQFRLDPPKPTANLEPYYPGWHHITLSKVAGERPERNSERDNYFGRTQAWGSVLSGGLAGHIYGTGAYDGTTIGEDPGSRLYIWDALKYPAGEQVGFVRKFLQSEGDAYQDLQLASNDLAPRKSAGSAPEGLDGWAYMMRTPDKDLAMLYFENRCQVPEVNGFDPDETYQLHWFDPINGTWQKGENQVTADDGGSFDIDLFPDGEKTSTQDWALKIKLVD